MLVTHGYSHTGRDDPVTEFAMNGPARTFKNLLVVPSLLFVTSLSLSLSTQQFKGQPGKFQFLSFAVLDKVRSPGVTILLLMQSPERLISSRQQGRLISVQLQQAFKSFAGVLCSTVPLPAWHMGRVIVDPHRPCYYSSRVPQACVLSVYIGMCWLN